MTIATKITINALITYRHDESKVNYSEEHWYDDKYDCY